MFFPRNKKQTILYILQIYILDIDLKILKIIGAEFQKAYSVPKITCREKLIDRRRTTYSMICELAVSSVLSDYSSECNIRGRFSTRTLTTNIGVLKKRKICWASTN